MASTDKPRRRRGAAATLRVGSHTDGGAGGGVIDRPARGVLDAVSDGSHRASQWSEILFNVAVRELHSSVAGLRRHDEAGIDQGGFHGAQRI